MNIHLTVKGLVVFIGGALSYKTFQDSNWWLLSMSAVISIFAYACKYKKHKTSAYDPCDDVVDDYYINRQCDYALQKQVDSIIVDVNNEE